MVAAEMLRYARRKKGWSQRDLAAAGGVPQPAVARIEAGRVVPRVDTLARLLLLCDVVLEPFPSYGAGVDRSGIQERLSISPAQRLELTVRAARSLRRVRGGR